MGRPGSRCANGEHHGGATIRMWFLSNVRGTIASPSGSSKSRDASAASAVFVSWRCTGVQRAADRMGGVFLEIEMWPWALIPDLTSHEHCQRWGNVQGGIPSAGLVVSSKSE